MTYRFKLSLTAMVGLGLMSYPVISLAQDDASLPLPVESLDSATPDTPIEGDFPADFFAPYAPRTAQDMVVQIPGFQINSGDSGRRGLGQGGANILINGERLTGKTDAGAQLSRIAAANVVRIEIRDGASLDIPGLSGQVANIITESKGVSGTWSWAPQFRERLEPSLAHIHLTVSGETGNLSYTVEARNEDNTGLGFGPETLTDANGTLFEQRDEINKGYFDAPGLVADLTWKPKTDHVGNLNLEVNKNNFRRRELSSLRAVTDQGQDLEAVFSFGEDEWNASAGADYEFPLGPGKLKTIGYYRFEDSPTESRFSTFSLDGTQESGSIFSRSAKEGEAIGRIEYGWSKAESRDWTLGVEAAFNFLDIESQLQALEDDAFVDVDLDGASSRVEERRAEATLTHNRALSPKWDLQVSLGAEVSELEQTGGLSRNFFRPKGFALATYKPDSKTNLRFKAEREVGQLSFFDFIASVDLINDQDRAANINLVPAQSWLGSIEYERDFGQGNIVKLNPYVALISDLVDRIPVGEDGDAIGNLDTAVRYGVDFNMTLKGEMIGWNGTQFDLEVEWRDSSVDDPLIGLSRRLSNDKTTYWQADFRHDIPKTQWAYGGQVREYAGAPSFRLFSIEDSTLTNPITSLFIEHKDVLGMKVVFEAFNLLDSTENYERRLFTDRRDRGQLDFIEYQERPFGGIYTITFSGTF